MSDLGNGKKIALVAGVARLINNAWTLLENIGHTMMHISSIETLNSSSFKINYDFTATKVLSLVATTDESYASKGIYVGASVGTDNSIINVYKRSAVMIEVIKNGETFTATNGVTVAVKSHNTLGDYLEITHNMLTVPTPLSLNANDWKVLGYQANVIKIQPWANGSKVALSTLNDGVALMLSGEGMVTDFVHPTSSNIWIYGVLEID